jgi:2-hydroxy-6-oxonona-2,4-dienedioate hydrolase
MAQETIRVKFVEIDGVRTRYYEAGQGHPVVLIHGVRMTADFWIRTIEDLSTNYLVVAPDLLGCGFTEGLTTEGQPPHRELLQHLIGFMDHLGLQDVSLVGSSLGGWLTALAYFRQPERYRDLVFVGCEVILSGDQALQRARSEGSQQNGSRVFEDPSLARVEAGMANIVADITKIPEAVLLLQLTSSALPGAALAYQRRAAGLTQVSGSPDLMIGERLREVKVPVLGVWGAVDPRGDREAARTVSNLVPDGQFVVMEDVGHLPYIERPQEFNKLLRAFLAQHS